MVISIVVGGRGFLEAAEEMVCSQDEGRQLFNYWMEGFINKAEILL